MQQARPKEERWIHVLLKGERSNQAGNEVDSYVRTFVSKSLNALSIPILEFGYKNLDRLGQTIEDAMDESEQGDQFDFGLILTSPRAVEATRRSFKSEKLNNLKKIDNQLVFVVGQKTAVECEQKLGVKWNAESATSGSSALLSNVIKSTCSIRTKPIRLIYPKSSLADETIEEALAELSNIVVKSIVVYETTAIKDAKEFISDRLRNHLELYRNDAATATAVEINEMNLVLNFVLFSPSGVECICKIALEDIFTYLIDSINFVSRVRCEFSSIGRTTEAALKSAGVEVLCVADKPNAESLVDNILRQCPAALWAGALAQSDAD